MAYTPYQRTNYGQQPAKKLEDLSKDELVNMAVRYAKKDLHIVVETMQALNKEFDEAELLKGLTRVKAVQIKNSIDKRIKQNEKADSVKNEIADIF